MYDGSTIYGNDGPVNGAAFIPASASSAPDCALEIFGYMLVVFLVDLVSDFEAADSFCL